jgi:hypothetical protein
VQTATGSHTAPPKTVGSIQMKDFSFAFHLPKPFSGKGYVRTPDQGAQDHEISLVRIQGNHTAQEVRQLIESGTQQPISRPADTSPLCLIDDSRSHKLHAQLGMIGAFTVARP